MDPARDIAPALQLAVAWQPRSTRGALEALFRLDARLGRMVRTVKEPLLAQMRLAWWREELVRSGGGRQGRDPLLQSIARQWADQSPELAALVDGWEAMIGYGPLAGEVGGLAAGRSAALAAFARLAHADDHISQARAVGGVWTAAEIPGWDVPTPFESVRARALRGLAVLDGLARRAIARGEPMLAGRGAALLAMRLGMIGN